jgi:hypothetical protein
MRLQSIRRLKLIFIIIFFNINASCADSIVEIRGLHKELSCLSTVDQSVFRLIILDLNNCQTCNIWFPKLIKNGDTGIFIYFRGDPSPYNRQPKLEIFREDVKNKPTPLGQAQIDTHFRTPYKQFECRV